MRRFNAILLLLVGMARPPNAAKKNAKKIAATATKVAVPDEAPVVDPFNTAGENKETIFDTSVQSVRDWPGHAMQQQAWEWLSTNLTSMMNQLIKRRRAE